MNLVASIEKEKLLSYQAVIAAEEKERKRIAANLHDNLGAYAAAISLNIDQVAAGGETRIPLRELRSNSGFMVSMLSDTIWALKKESQSLTTISDRLKVFIQRLEPSHPGVRIEVKEDIENDIVFSPIHAFQLFQIMQEAINNALRHSAPKLVLVEIEYHENWKIKIIDDGSGLQEKNTDGNGLANMKMRSEDSGWNIIWRNNTHSGTIVEISPA
jgi:two-component system, NarL family, sensor kinase